MTIAKRILLVDDDTALRQSLAEQLRLLEELETEEAGDGAGALNAVRKAGEAGTGFSAILLDVGLPDMDGRDVCKLLRREGVQH